MEPVCDRHQILVSTGRQKVEYFLCNIFASHKIAVHDNMLQSVIARNWEETKFLLTGLHGALLSHLQPARMHQNA